jgi:hypothetical protein
MAGIRGLSQWETYEFPKKDERKNCYRDKKRVRDRERGQKMEIWKWNIIYIEQDQRDNNQYSEKSVSIKYEKEDKEKWMN